MALIKKQYTDNQTVITAQNLNDIQDEIINNAGEISALNDNTVHYDDTVSASTTNSYYKKGVTLTHIGADAKGFPADYSHIETVKVNEDRCHQLSFTRTGDAVRFRQWDASSGWKAWQQLALKSDLTRTNIPITNVITPSRADKFVCYKSGNSIFFEITNVNFGTLNTDTVVARIPQAYAPQGGNTFFMLSDRQLGNVMMYVSTNGNISLNKSKELLYGSGSYAI